MAKEMVKQENPWDVPNIQEFLYYNCPECDTRVKDSEVFVQHALDNHVLSKSYLNKAMLEIVSNDQDNISDHEMEEIKDRKPAQEELYMSQKKFMAVKLHKVKIEPDVLLEVPDHVQDYNSDSDIAVPVESDEDDVKPDKPFFCDICDRFFTSAHSLNIHNSFIHSAKADKKNKCDMCDLKCNNAQALRKHEVETHFEEVVCDICDYKCHSKRMLERHMKTHRRIKCDQCDAAYCQTSSLAVHAKEKHFESVSCEKCEYKCHSKVMLEAHMKTFHKIKDKYDTDTDGIFTCRVCNFKTQNEEDMKDHQREHTDIKWNYKCELCEATFNTKSKYEEHKDVVHMGKLVKKCKECDFSCKRKHELRLHIKTVHENIDLTHICTICGKSVIKLKQHMKTKHPENDEGGTCEKCGMFFITRDKLSRHKSKRHTRKFQVCTICEKFFVGAHKQKLIDHYTDEHGIFCNKTNIFVCGICKIKVTSNKELTRHYQTVHETKDDFHCSKCVHNEPTKALLSFHYIDVHEMNPFYETDLVNEKAFKTVHVLEDGKEFECPICSKKLTSKVTLNNHIKQVHDKSNHVKCDHCPRTFNYPSELKKHVLFKHTAPTRFPCSQCSYVTNLRNQLNGHIRKVHEKEYRFKCTVCEKQYKQRNQLQEHLLKDHDILYKY